MSTKRATNLRRVLLAIIGAFIAALLLLEITFFFSTPNDNSSADDDATAISVVFPTSDATVHRKLNMQRTSPELELPESPNSNIKNNNADPRDWFNATRWHSHSQINFSCPVFEDVCVYDQHFYVHSEADEFDLDWKKHKSDLLGTNMPNVRESEPVYRRFFHATKWKHGEYTAAQCRYDDIYNHLILEASYQTMLGEFYSRTLR